ncbi:MAG: glycosyltransferase family 4 protein [Chloroflexi bacterium]|nr:glycosyltransferase family 4 protein [Chloroflexota bacterium]
MPAYPDDPALPLVALNAHLLSDDASYRAAGVSRFIHGLLANLPLVDPTLRYAAFVEHEGLRYPGWRTEFSRWAAGSPCRRIVWEQLGQPWRIRQLRAALLHAPVNVGPALGRLVAQCPTVVTVHDLSFVRYPELFTRARRLYQQHLTPYTVRHAAAITADSQATKNDLVNLYGVDANKVRVVYPGVDAGLVPIADESRLAALRHRHRLPEHFVLFLGTIEPRKNLVTLLEAYALLQRRAGLPHHLVIAGGKGWHYEQVFAAVERLGLSEQVHFPGYVSAGELPLWYNAAAVLAYPSLYEGFGLPPLEAMACGTPVVVSNVSSLPEVVGSAAPMVDPHDVAGWADTIARLLTDQNFADTVRADGLRRAQAFTWERTARQVSQVYHEVLGV